MFGAARWRFTLWFTLALAVILVLIGAAVYFTTRAVLLNQVNSDLESRTGQEQRVLLPRLRGGGRDGPGGDIVIGPAFTSGGYFYALSRPDGELITSTANVDPAGLAGGDAIQEAVDDGHSFVDTESSEGDSLRVYVTRLEGPVGDELVMQVGRSTEPERQALRRLLVVLAGGFGVGLGLSLVGGYFLADRALRPIRKAMDSQRSFIADASHELRTPLAVVRANAELLKRHESEPVSANVEAVDDIISHSDRLGRLVGQMLTLARVDSGQADLARAEVALAEVAEEAARSMRILAQQQGITLEAKLDASVRLQGDADRLRELMVVLLDNGIKYTDSGGKVTLEVRRTDGNATVRVSDTGRGIPSEALPHLFDRFYRVDKARSQEQGGTGLGLAIARWIVQAHGGSIRAESSPGVGTVMTVELPAS